MGRADVQIYGSQGGPDTIAYTKNVVEGVLKAGLGSYMTMRVAYRSGADTQDNGPGYNFEFHKYVACGSNWPAFGVNFDADYKWFQVLSCADPREGRTLDECIATVGLQPVMENTIDDCMNDNDTVAELVNPMHEDAGAQPYTPSVQVDRIDLPRLEDTGNSVGPLVHALCQEALKTVQFDKLPEACQGQFNMFYPPLVVTLLFLIAGLLVAYGVVAHNKAVGGDDSKEDGLTELPEH